MPGGTLHIGMKIVGAVASALCLCLPAYAEKIRIAHEHDDPRPFQLVINVLNESLRQYAPDHDLVWIKDTKMNQTRALQTLSQCDTSFDAFFSGYDPQREQALLQVNVPLTMGLLGVRGFVTNQERVARFEASPDTIKRWRIGSGNGWPDTRIMQDNHYRLQISEYRSLWRMLENERIDVFQRGIQEAQIEIEDHKRDGKAFALVSNALMIYPLDFFLYVSPCKTEMKDIIEQALQQAHQEGLLESLILADPYAAVALDMLQNPDVTSVVLANRETSQTFNDLQDRYWLSIISQRLAQ